ncbi:hypothetical protein AVEN_101717-1 [Araneus ventricosus]|uniref:Uncharacterized protein n=1 Tax=Araneus ventricosus TaxID=182803 RepID=A0A4Y2SKE9_ARAVE|nr:hypothetical protein AVEN_101717-1 [Araneus ventricosus]
MEQIGRLILIVFGMSQHKEVTRRPGLARKVPNIYCLNYPNFNTCVDKAAYDALLAGTKRDIPSSSREAKSQSGVCRIFLHTKCYSSSLGAPSNNKNK